MHRQSNISSRLRAFRSWWGFFQAGRGGILEYIYRFCFACRGIFAAKCRGGPIAGNRIYRALFVPFSRTAPLLLRRRPRDIAALFQHTPPLVSQISLAIRGPRCFYYGDTKIPSSSARGICSLYSSRRRMAPWNEVTRRFCDAIIYIQMSKRNE